MTKDQRSQLSKTLWAIVDCLSLLDVLIFTHSEKFEALKTHRKSLRQQLFPDTRAV
jgi:type I restriction enzyme S subunit